MPAADPSRQPSLEEGASSPGGDPLRAPEASPPSFLALEGLNKFFGSHQVIKDLSLDAHAGEIVALLGPSGSGKTTVLRLLGGFERPDVGRVLVEGSEVTDLPPARRGFGMVFQSYALFPHLTVGKNVAFGLEARGGTPKQIADRVGEMLNLVRLAGFQNRRVAEISGGQQQRVALARALAPEPRVLMLDEPLSNLDPALREATRRELRQVLKEVGITTLLVTHEQEEAFELGDRVGVLNEGRLEQVAPPRELYERPATAFVATFVGRASVLQGIVEAVEGRLSRIRLLGKGSEIGIADWWAASREGLIAGEAVDLVARPESLGIGESGESGGVEGRVVSARYTGPVTFFRVLLDLGAEVEVVGSAGTCEPGQRVWVVPRPGTLAPRIFPRDRA